MLLTPTETAEKKILYPTKSKSLPAELDLAVPVTCSVDLQGIADSAIKDLQVVITNATVRPRNLIASSTVSLKDMDLDLTKSRASRLHCKSTEKSLFFRSKHHVDDTPKRQTQCRPPRVVLQQMMELKTLQTELWNYVAIPVTYVQKLRDKDVAIEDQVVTTNTAVKPIRADPFGNVLRHFSGAYCAARIVPSNKLLLCHCRCCYIEYTAV
ncbi:unnamed protein product [Macrosiphum euphorbiae]|nr:unnamed protein product [Macrosiphum euphorbiae]